MKKTFLILIACVLNSCSTFISDVEKLKPINNYSTEDVIIHSNKVVDAEITFVNNQSVKTKLQALKHINGGLDEASVSSIIVIYGKNAKRHFLRNKVIKSIKLIDYSGNNRFFVNRGEHLKALQELMYDGKFKWFIESTYQGLGNIVQVHYIVDEQNNEYKLNSFKKFKTKLKEIVNHSEDLYLEIDNANNYSDIIKILSKY